ncbi:hypothetical protein V144x_02700 [Gimesia aquarii]|uniref:Uncharacterized protein n=1 Tax=Gimesia aquarii TaxID=2527964 RepID=A0A517VP91_9PLAN|nr:hypothetical protein V144x_02700 [Gimesia aquarii]
MQHATLDSPNKKFELKTFQVGILDQNADAIHFEATLYIPPER